MCLKGINTYTNIREKRWGDAVNQNTDELKIAYTLIPPVLASMPAKRWTSISLLLHSYAVARTFEDLVRVYTKGSTDTTLYDDVFLIGLLHDLGQKLRVRDKPSDEKIIKWVAERLEFAGKGRDEVRYFVKYLYTNPAETASDPSYPRQVWGMLMLADRLQSVDNALEIVEVVTTINQKFGLDFHVKPIAISIPQPFMRAVLSEVVHEKLITYANNNSEVVIPLTTPFGSVVLTSSKDLKVEIDWNEVSKRDLVPEPSKYAEYASCCENVECRETVSALKKSDKSGEKIDIPKEWIEKYEKYRNMKISNCNPAEYPDQNVTTHRVVLSYFTDLEKDKKLKPYLPKEVEKMIQGIEIKGVEYREGSVLCPLCGFKTPVAVAVDFLKTISSKHKTQQWVRRFAFGNIKTFTSPKGRPKKYGLDPLCIGDAFARAGMGDIFISFKFRVAMTVNVLREIGYLAHGIVHTLGTSTEIPRWFDNSGSQSVIGAVDYESEEFEKFLSTVTKNSNEKTKVMHDMFSSTVMVEYRSELRSKQEEWTRDMVTAGVLALWGLYPLTISDAITFGPSEKLLTYYKGQRPLYDFAPSNPELERFVPYVASAMAGMSYLDYVGSMESVPAYFEILSYPPELSPTVAMYAAPHLFSLVERISSRLGEI